MDPKLTSVMKPFAVFGKRFVGSVKDETPTILDCIIRQSNSTSDPECFHSRLRFLEESVVVVDRKYI